MGDSSEGALRLLPRLGYAARGLVYLVVGGFAVLAAIGSERRAPDERGALLKILQQPLGDVLLALVALGLVAFALWRLAQSLLDADGHGTSGKALVIRAGLFGSAVFSAALAVSAVDLIFRLSPRKSGANDWSAWIMAQPFGRPLLGAIGAAIIGAGLATAYKGVRADLAKRFDMDRQDLRWAMPISRIGLVARGLVFVLAGGFAIAAAISADAGQAKGLGDALRWLQGQPYGPWLLGFAGVGLLAFGAYGFIEAAYRRIGCSLAFPASSTSIRAGARP